ncbi:hypothetical protein BH09SUM1_BH09SUM1_00220 [soil metagenome]
MRGSFLAFAISGLLMLASPAMLSNLHPQKYISARGDMAGRAQKDNSGAIGYILGEFRASLSDMMFMKTEVYLHSGIRYKDTHASDVETTGTAVGEGQVSATEREVQAMHIRPGETKTEEPDDHGDAGAPTMIPTPMEDFRSFIGEIERDVKPWQDPSVAHRHTAGEELLPWYRMMTLADPNNVRGYMMGTWWLFAEKSEKSDREALNFIDEGVANNPEAFQLWLMKGRVHTRLNETDAAIKALGRATELASAQRPAGGAESDTWTEYMEDDFRGATTLHFLLLRNEGRIAEAKSAAEAALRLDAEYGPALKLLKEIGEGKYQEGVKTSQE